jgi:dephospho-CoA kinase
VDSIRNPAEVEVLRRLPHFVLFGVRASLEDRYERSLQRGRSGDPATLEGFQQRERQENSMDPEGQQLEATFRLADRIVDNDGDLTALQDTIDRCLREYHASATGEA